MCAPWRLQTATKMLAVKQDPYVRAGVVNSAINIYIALDDWPRARDLLALEASTSNTPHYYIGDLADAEEHLGNNAARARAAGRGLSEGAGTGVALPVGLSVSRWTAAPRARGHRDHREGGPRSDRGARRAEPHSSPHAVAPYAARHGAAQVEHHAAACCGRREVPGRVSCRPAPRLPAIWRPRRAAAASARQSPPLAEWTRSLPSPRFTRPLTRWPRFAPAWCSTRYRRCRTKQHELDGALYWTELQDSGELAMSPELLAVVSLAGPCAEARVRGQRFDRMFSGVAATDDRESVAALGLTEEQFVAACREALSSHRAGLGAHRARGGQAGGGRTAQFRRSRRARRRRRRSARQ